MTDLVAYLVGGVAMLVAAYAAWHTVRDRPFSDPLFYAVGGLELLLVGLLIGGSVALGRTSRDVDGVLFVSYLVTIVVIPPAAVLWGIAEKTRWGTGVVVIAMISTAVLIVRLLGIWKGAYV